MRKISLVFFVLLLSTYNAISQEDESRVGVKMAIVVDGEIKWVKNSQFFIYDSEGNKEEIKCRYSPYELSFLKEDYDRLISEDIDSMIFRFLSRKDKGDGKYSDEFYTYDINITKDDLAYSRYIELYVYNRYHPDSRKKFRNIPRKYKYQYVSYAHSSVNALTSFYWYPGYIEFGFKPSKNKYRK